LDPKTAERKKKTPHPVRAAKGEKPEVVLKGFIMEVFQTNKLTLI